MRAVVVSHSEAGPRTLARISGKKSRYVLNGGLPDDVKLAPASSSSSGDRGRVTAQRA